MALLQSGGGAAEMEARELTLRHLAEVRRKITELKKLAAALKGLVSGCTPGNQTACPFVASLVQAAQS